MKPQGQFQAFLEVRRLADTREKRLAGKVSFREIINPAEDHRYPPEHFVPVVAEEVEGVIVRRDDQVERVLEYLCSGFAPVSDHRVVIHPFRAHVFYEDSGFFAHGFQRGDNTPGNVVSPLESLMV